MNDDQSGIGSRRGLGRTAGLSALAAAALATTLVGAGSGVAQAANTPGLSLQILAGAPVDNGHLGMIVANDTISYRFVVTNNTGGALHGLQVNDVRIGHVSCASTTVADGASVNCQADKAYSIQQSEVDAGNVHNYAWVGAINAGSTALVRADATPVDTAIAAHPSLRVQQIGYPVPVDVNRNGQTDIGEPIFYQYAAINAGNVTMHNVTIDNNLVGSASCLGSVSATLDARMSYHCYAPHGYKITASDIAAQKRPATAVITGFTPTNAKVQNGVFQQTGLKRSLRLTVQFWGGSYSDVNHDGKVDAGDTVSDRVLLRNTGNYRLTAVSVVTARPQAYLHCYSTTIAPGDAYLCSTVDRYTITAADERAGYVLNSANAAAPSDPYQGHYVRATTVYLRIAVNFTWRSVGTAKAAA